MKERELHHRILAFCKTGPKTAGEIYRHLGNQVTVNDLMAALAALKAAKRIREEKRQTPESGLAVLKFYENFYEPEGGSE